MFIPLFNKSNYTLLSSLLKIDDIISYAKENNLNEISIVDTNMYGTMEFIKKCEKENIKPIIGLELLLDDINIVVFAKDYDGYKSLIKLSSIQNERQLTIDDIKKYNKSLIAVINYSFRNRYESIKEIYDELYLGYRNKQEEKECLIITKDIVFFRENLYKDKNDSDTLPYLYRIRDGKTISDDITYDTEDHSINVNNIMDLSSNTGLINTISIADKCEIIFRAILIS